MKNVDYLIVGGSAAGTTAAEVVRNQKPDALITIVSDEPYEEYSRVLMPHYVRHKVAREQVFLKNSQWYKEKNIELLKGVKAIKLDSKGQIVGLDNGEEIHFGKLLIATGGDVVRMKVPGFELGNILYLRTIDDGDAVVKGTKEKAVIVGGGFIGLEFASCFKLNGANDITLLVIEPYYWAGKLDEDSSKVLVGVLEKNDIKVLTNEEVDHFEPSSAKATEGQALTSQSATEGQGRSVGAVVTKSGKRFEAGVVGVGIGIRSELEWLSGSGININKSIVTNEYLETNLPNVYAAGDCAEFHDVVFDRQHIVGNWANATSQGRTAGMNMTGQKTVFETASSYSITFFEGSCSFIGVTDEEYADEIVCRGSVESGKMTRIFIKKVVGRRPGEASGPEGISRIVGATVINNQSEVAPLTIAVKEKKDVSKTWGKLSDTTHELRDVLI